MSKEAITVLLIGMLIWSVILMIGMGIEINNEENKRNKYMMCQFPSGWGSECNKECEYFNTCTRNPHNREENTSNKLASTYLSKDHTQVIIIGKDELREMLHEERRITVNELEKRLEAEVNDITEKMQGRKNGKTMASMMLTVLDAEKVILEGMKE